MLGNINITPAATCSRLTGGACVSVVPGQDVLSILTTAAYDLNKVCDSTTDQVAYTTLVKQGNNYCTSGEECSLKNHFSYIMP